MNLNFRATVVHDAAGTPTTVCDIATPTNLGTNDPHVSCSGTSLPAGTYTVTIWSTASSETLSGSTTVPLFVDYGSLGSYVLTVTFNDGSTCDTLAPVAAPTRYPTAPPVMSPTRFPTVSPTAPVAAPTRAPTVPPGPAEIFCGGSYECVHAPRIDDRAAPRSNRVRADRPALLVPPGTAS